MAILKEANMAKTRSYLIIDGTMYCYSSTSDKCIVVKEKQTLTAGKSGQGEAGSGFAQAEISSFHTSDLAEATKKINAIFEEVSQKKADKDLSLLVTPKGLLLAWTEHGAISSNDEPGEIQRALKLK